MKKFYALILTTACTICIFEPKIIKGKLPKKKSVIKPDIVSKRAKITDYYFYDFKKRRWIWSGK